MKFGGSKNQRLESAVLTVWMMDLALEILRARFGYPEFRPLQKEAIQGLLQGEDVLALLPTGGGKSLCYQIPAAVARAQGPGSTLVISPLIALMKDQLAQLNGRGFCAVSINSAQSDEENESARAALRDGRCDLIYVSPEQAVSASFGALLEDAKIALLAIDEAHCISEWGHDFRPEYGELGSLKRLLNVPCIAVTATATPQVAHQIIEGLSLQEPRLVQGRFARENLRFEVRPLVEYQARMQDLWAELSDLPRGGRAIVYCSTQKNVERVADELIRRGMLVGHYHAGLSVEARERAHRAYARRRTPVLIATCAFGMGVDDPDVRKIIHFEPPDSLEAYYQEAGRAGRDGAPATCILYFGESLLAWRKRAGRGDRLAPLRSYAGTEFCRQALLCAHFVPDEEHDACGKCDLCAPSDEAPAEPTRSVSHDEGLQTILAATAATTGPVTRLALAAAMRGSRDRELRSGGLLRLPENGALENWSKEQTLDAIDALIEQGALHHEPEMDLVSTRALESKASKTAKKKSGGLRRKKGLSRSAIKSGTKKTQARAPLRRSAPKPAPKTQKVGNSTPLGSALETLRARWARKLKLRPAKVLSQRTLTAIELHQPASLEALAMTTRLDQMTLDRLGEELLEIVRRYGSPE